MKKMVMVVMAASMFTAALPGFALAHGNAHDPADVQCAKDCQLRLKDCSHDVDTIQQKIRKLQAAIKSEGAQPQTAADIKRLQQKLADAKETLVTLTSAGH